MTIEQLRTYMMIEAADEVLARSWNSVSHSYHLWYKEKAGDSFVIIYYDYKSIVGLYTNVGKGKAISLSQHPEWQFIVDLAEQKAEQLLHKEALKPS